MKKEKIEPFVRINSRVTRAQFEFIKVLAAKNKITEGEAHRLIISAFMKSPK
jgi:hypothetical protein